MTRNALLLLLAITSSGCASVASTPHPFHAKIGAMDTLSTPASASSLIIKSDDSQKFCTQPGADATFSESEGDSFSLVTVPGAKEGESMSDASASDEMQGRAPAVLIARELLYRLCELSLNHPGQLDKILPLYETTLAVIEAGWTKESERYTVLESLTTTETMSNTGPGEYKAPEYEESQNEAPETEVPE